MLAAVVLAAGSSRRMGARNKLLLMVDGELMIRRVVRTALDSRVSQVLVVTGFEQGRMQGALADLPVRFVHNPDFAQGMSTSVRAGAAALGSEITGALFLLGDMPKLSHAHLDAVIDAFDPVAGASICVPTFAGKRGNPVLWGARHFDAMRALQGDVGARQILAEHPNEVRLVAMPDAAVLLDVDTPEVLAQLQG